MDIQVLASGSKGNCYKVRDGKTSILLDCGVAVKEIIQKLNFQISDIEGCLCTHEHLDHSKSFKDLLKYGIEVFMTHGTAMAFDEDFFKPTIIKPLESFTVGTFDILPFETQHDSNEPVGFLIYSRVTKEKLLFATDTYYIKYRFADLNYIMVECNYALDMLKQNVDAGRLPESLKNRLLHSHFSLDNVKKFLRSNDLSKVKEIYLLHLSESNSDEVRFKKEIQQLTGKVVIVA